MGPVLTSVLALLIAMTSIQVGASLAKSMFPMVGAPGATALRLIFASIMLSVVWRPWNARISRQEGLSVLLYGLALGGMNLLFYYAIERIPLGITVALEFVGPLSVALLSSRRAWDLLWIAFAGVGIFLVLPETQSMESSLDRVGVGFALAAGVCWALYIVYGKLAGLTLRGGTATTLGMIVATLVVLPFGASKAWVGSLNSSVIWIAVLVAFLSSALPYSFEMVALKKLPRSTFGTLMSLEPAVAAVSGAVLLHELLTVSQWAGILLVVLASVGTSIQAARPANKSRLA